MKHFAAFPGFDVRAISLRGDQLGGEPRYKLVQGRDGYIYLRGAIGLYRLLDIEGHYDRISDIWPCNGLRDAIDNRGPIPLDVCGDGLAIVVVHEGIKERQRISVPKPSATAPFEYHEYYPRAMVSSVAVPSTGGYWFSYGFAQGIGRAWPSGRVVIRHFPALGATVSMAALGDDLYVADDRCQVGRVHNWSLVDVRKYPCSPVGTGVTLSTTDDGAVWILDARGNTVERIEPNGSSHAWRLTMSPYLVAQESNMIAYVFGSRSQEGRYQPMFAVIPKRGLPSEQRSPMWFGDALFDARGRLWIADSQNHALVLLSRTGTPEGAVK